MHKYRNANACKAIYMVSMYLITSGILRIIVRKSHCKAILNGFLHYNYEGAE